MPYKHKIRRFGQLLGRPRCVEHGDKLDLKLPSEAVDDSESDSALPKLDPHIFSSLELPLCTGVIYLPLLEGQFRIIRLLPGSFDDPVHCELDIYQLGTPEEPGKYGCPLYEAISYVWGDSKDTVEVLMGSERRPLLITRNLFNALKVFRYLNVARMMWADAICINQVDLTERGSQVAMMGAIYSTCERCNVWLGHEIEFNFEHMPPVPGLDIETWNLATRELDRGTPMLDVQATLDLLHLGVDRSPLDTHENPEERLEGIAVSSLINILSRAWWFRLWTFQEVILPLKHGKAVRICIGKHDLDFELLFALKKNRLKGKDLYRVCSMFVGHPDSDIRAMLRVLLRFALMLDAMRTFAEGAGSVAHLSLLSSRTCSDPRDAIYALLGYSDHDLFDGTPDYTISVSHCYSRATRMIVNHEFSLEHLHWMNPVLSTTSLPSWALDFQRGLDPANPHKPYISRSEDQIDIISSRIPTEVLPVRARFLSTVKEVLSSCTRDRSPESSTRTLSEWHEAAVRADATDRQFVEMISDSDLEIYVISGVLANSRTNCQVFQDIMARKRERRFAFVVADNKDIGVAYECVQPGDVIATLVGLDYLCVLRPARSGQVLESGYVTSKESYLFLGTCQLSRDSSAEDELKGPWLEIDLV